MRAPFARLVSLFAICDIATALVPAQIPLGRQTASDKLEECIPDEYWRGSSPLGFSLPLNHSDPKSETFCNRYWLQKTWYKAGGPVFILHAGESRGEEVINYIDSDKNTPDKDLSVFETFLQAFNGLGIVMEHRYYGGSLPKGIVLKKKKQADFRYHTTEWALADVHVFVSGFWSKEYPKVNFSPKQTRWISIGGSYPGMQAAMMRIGYPHTIFAAYAASAPIQASIEMPGYFEQVWDGINAYSKACAADLTAAIQEIDKRLKNKSVSKSLKESLLGCPRSSKNEVADAEFASDLSSMFNNFQELGMADGKDDRGRDKPNRLRQLCEYLAVGEKGEIADDRGWAAVQDVQTVITKLQTGNALKLAVGAKDLGYGPCSKDKDKPSTEAETQAETGKEKRERNEADNISWSWQRCRDFGYFFVSNRGPHQIVLSAMDRAYQQNYCSSEFELDGGKAYMPAQPEVEAFNNLFKGWNARPTRTFWTAGQYDPWTALSPFSKQAKNVIDQKVPSCAIQPLPKNPVFGYQLDGAVHCVDFNRTVSATGVASATFKDALTKWMAQCKTTTVLNEKDTLEGGCH